MHSRKDVNILADFKIELGVKLDTSDLKSEIGKLDGKHKIKLGVDLGVNDIRDRIKAYNQNTNNIKVKLKATLDTKDLQKQINNLSLDTGKNGKGVKVPIDTASLTESLGKVEKLISEVKNSIGTLDDKVDTKSLVASVNQIASALEKATKESDGLVSSLKALSQKDFNFNFNLKAGDSNPAQLMTKYGQEVSRTALPALEKQILYLENAIQKKSKNAIQNYFLNKYKDFGGRTFATNLRTESLFGIDSDNKKLTDNKQMLSAEKYIGHLTEIASLNNIDLSGFRNEFSKSATEIVDDTTKIQTGVKEFKDQVEKFKSIFGGINAEELTGILEPLLQDITKIREALETFSSVGTIDGLVASFQELFGVLDRLTANITTAKESFDGIGNATGSLGQGGSSIESVDNDLKQVTVTAEGTANAIKSMRDAMSSMNFNHSSINAVTKDLEEMGIEISKISVKDKGLYLDVTVKGIDSIGRAVTEVRQLDAETKQVFPVSKTFTQSFETSADIAKKEAKETEEAFNKLKSLGKEISSLDFKIAGLDADKNKAEIAELTNQLNRLEAEYNDLFNTFEKKLSPGQVDELVGDIVKGTEKLDVLKAKMADTVESQKITDDFEKLKSIAKEISNTRIDILKSDDIAEISEATAKLSRLKTEYDELLAKTRGSLSNKQIGELGNIVDQGDTNALKAFNSEVQEFIKLQNQIENKKFEIGKLELLGGKENEIADLKRQLTELEDTYNHLMNTFMKKVSGNADILQMDDFKGLENGIEKATTNAENRLKQFEAQYADVQAKLAEDIKLDIDNGKFDNEVSTILDKFSKLSGESSELKEHIEAVDTALKKMKEAAGTDNEVADAEKLVAAQEEYAKAIKKVNNELNIQAREERAANAAEKLSQDRKSLKLDMVNWLKQNTKAAKEYGDEIQKLIASCDKLDKVGLASTRQKFNNITKDAELHGKTGLTTWDKLVDKVKEYSVYFSVADVAMRSIQALKDMFEQVKAIDTAMTELKKVTDESDASYDKFLTNAASRAKEIGTTIDGLVTSTADFARLGYSFDQAAGLAEVANIYTVVGDEIEGVEEATQSLVSTMAAFKDEMNGMSDSEFALSIVDKFNEVSNNFSISSGGIGEALTRSASSLATANNTLDESIALITAANTVVNLCHAA